MGFLDKAKSALKDVAKELDNATEKLSHLGDDSATAGSSSTATSQANTVSATPASSIAPKKMSGPKLPLAIRKEVRDDWETKVPELEASLTSILGVPWTIDVDPSIVYVHALETGTMGRMAKEKPGQVLYNYISSAADNFKVYLDKFGEDGKQELNKVASAHVITITQAENVDFSISGSDIVEGVFRILYTKTNFGGNIKDATSPDNLPKVINKAGASAGGASVLDFDARTGIKNDYDPQVAAIKTKIETILAVDSLTLDPSFEANFAKLQSAGCSRRDWQKQLGGTAIRYFEGLAKNLEAEGFGKDDMLQEGLAEVMEKKLIKFEVVDKLEKKTYHEVLPVDGVLYIRTVPGYYFANVGDVGQGLVGLL